MKRRDALLETLLSLFIPFYIIYWSYVTAKELEKTYGHKAPSLFLLLAPALIFVFALIPLMFGVLSGSEEGFAASGIGFFLIILILFPLSFALSLVYYYKFGGNVEKVVGPAASRMLVLILFWLVSPAGVYIVQEKLNTLSQGPQDLQPPVAPLGPQSQNPPA